MLPRHANRDERRIVVRGSRTHVDGRADDPASKDVSERHALRRGLHRQDRRLVSFPGALDVQGIVTAVN